jgi:hypothetical protein
MKIINKLITILNIIKKLIIILKIILFSIVIYLLIKLILIIINNTTDISTSLGCLSIFYKRRKRIDYSILNHWKQMDEENILFENNKNQNLIVNKGKMVKHYNNNIINYNRDKELPPIPINDSKNIIDNSLPNDNYYNNENNIWDSWIDYLSPLSLIRDYSPSLTEMELLKSPKTNFSNTQNLTNLNTNYNTYSFYNDVPELTWEDYLKTPKTLRKNILDSINEINNCELSFIIIIKDKLIKIIKSLIYLFINKIIFIIKLTIKFIIILIKRLFIILIIVHIKKFFVLIDYNVILNYSIFEYINMINNSVILSYIVWIKNINANLINNLKVLNNWLNNYEIQIKDKIKKFNTMFLLPIEIPNLKLEDYKIETENNSTNDIKKIAFYKNYLFWFISSTIIFVGIWMYFYNNNYIYNTNNYNYIYPNNFNDKLYLVIQNYNLKWVDQNYYKIPLWLKDSTLWLIKIEEYNSNLLNILD